MMLATEIPWEILGGGGAAGLVAILFVWHTRHTGAAHQKANEIFADAVKDGNEKWLEASAKFAQTAEKFTQAVVEADERCNETTTTLLREQREHAAEEKRVLIDTIKEFRKP